MSNSIKITLVGMGPWWTITDIKVNSPPTAASHNRLQSQLNTWSPQITEDLFLLDQPQFTAEYNQTNQFAAWHEGNFM